MLDQAKKGLKGKAEKVKRRQKNGAHCAPFSLLNQFDYFL